MYTFKALTENYILIAAMTGWLVAQILKTLIHFYFTKTFVTERLVGSGGMPSSHSSTVCALATASAVQYGYGSFQFALSLIFAIVVMYDASGVRRQAGNQAKVLNELIALFSMTTPGMDTQRKLKEFIGHTPLQVFVGAILGVIIALLLAAV